MENPKDGSAAPCTSARRAFVVTSLAHVVAAAAASSLGGCVNPAYADPAPAAADAGATRAADAAVAPHYEGLGLPGSDGLRMGGGIGIGIGIGIGRLPRIPDYVRVRVRPPAVSPGLTADAVRRVTLRNLGQFSYCYAQALTSAPRLAGEVSLRFEIGPTGSTAHAASETAAPLRGVAACMERAVLRWMYPTPDGVPVVHVTVPVTLTAPPPGRSTARPPRRPGGSRM